MKGFTIKLRPLGLLTVGWSHPVALGADVPFIRLYVRGQTDPIYYIPASTLKGALRSAASRVAESYPSAGFTSCGQTRPELIEAAHRRPDGSTQPCSVCSLFGMPGRNLAPRLLIEDLRPEDKGKQVGPSTVTRVRIGDANRKAAEGGLYTVEAITKGVFVGQIYYDEGVKQLLPLLVLGIGALRLDRFGRRSAVDIMLEDTRGLRGDLPQQWHTLLTGLESWLWRGGGPAG